MKTLKAAILGAGFIGRAHLEAVRRLGFVEVVAIAQSSEARAKELAKQLHVPRAYGDYRDVLRDPDIDVIHNCTPNHLHYAINKAVLEHGKHLLSEKPLTMTSAEARDLWQTAKGKRLVAGVNFNYRQFPLVQQMRAMVRSGELGDVRIVRGEYLQDWLLYETDYNWRLEPQYGGSTRALGDIGSHLIDLAQYVSGKRIAEVFADMATVVPVRLKPRSGRLTFETGGADDAEPVKVDTEDYSSVLVRFDDGTRGVFTVSQVSPGCKNGLALYLDGSKAACGWEQEQPARLWIGRRDRANETLMRDPSLVGREVASFVHYPGGHEEGWADALKNMMLNFYRAVADGADAPPDSVASLEEGYRVMLVLDAVVRSAKEGRWVKVEEDGA